MVDKKDNKKTEEKIDLDDLSLSSLGVYMLYDEISSESAKDMCSFIIKANCIFPAEQPLTVFINSMGGESYDGFSIIDLMETSRLKIKTVGIGMIASMATLIFTAGSKGMRTLTQNSFFMTHQFSGFSAGSKYHELLAERTHFDELHNKFIAHFTRHSNMTEKQISDILLGPTDKWITPKEAIRYGLCDKVQSPWS